MRLKLSDALEWLARTEGLYLYGQPGEVVDTVTWAVGSNSASGEVEEVYAQGETVLKAIIAARKRMCVTFLDTKKGGLV